MWTSPCAPTYVKYEGIASDVGVWFRIRELLATMRHPQRCLVLNHELPVNILAPDKQLNIILKFEHIH